MGKATKTMRSMKFLGIAGVAMMGAVMAGMATKALASGFALREGSADWMANAFAGDTAKAYDAATAWSEPGWHGPPEPERD